MVEQHGGNETSGAVSGLVALCLERMSLGDSDPLPALCARHPDNAAELRRRMARLGAMGLAGADQPACPDTIGPYRIVASLGGGGMGQVWLGRQTDPVRRLVAVKVIRGFVHDPRARSRFDAERQAVASLQHPGIAQVLEAGSTDDGAPWYAMEFVEGLSVTDHADEQSLDIDARLELFLQVCDAITHAHQHGIIHRDLKPSNILVADMDGRPLVKVIDFGLAKALDDPLAPEGAPDPADGAPDQAEVMPSEPGLTGVGQAIGTPGFMSPEQAGLTGETVDTRTDVYALGVLLYELLVGEPPLDFGLACRGGLVEVQRVLRDVEPVRPSLRVAGLSEEQAHMRGLDQARWSRRLAGDVDWIAAKALARSRDDRYASVPELAADVRRHLALEPVLAVPPSATYRIGRFVRRHARAVAVGVLALVGLVVALAVITVLLGQSRSHLRSFDVLNDVLELSELERLADEELWPETPLTVEPLEAWLVSARTLLDRRVVYGELLAELDVRTPAGWEPRDHFLRNQLTSMVAAVDRFTATVANVEQRLDWAREIHATTLVAHEAEWARATASIANPRVCPAYGGLVMEPQLGLVPLGRDVRTGLWEFALPRPGERLPRRVHGDWQVDDDTCMVFVLIPAGTCRLGAQASDAEAPNYYAEASDWEGPLTDVCLDAFLLSKYEMTQGQWLRIAGGNPSRVRPETGEATLSHPVEQVSWRNCQRMLARIALELPTSAQWEYAARAGSPTPWWTGPDRAAVMGTANLADHVLLEHGGRGLGIPFDEWLCDGYVMHAPVDALAPNRFGLHNVIGNLFEWCRDRCVDYALATPRAGDGLLVPHDPASIDEDVGHDLRGGSFYSTFSGRGRSTLRLQQKGAGPAIGVRPSLRLGPPGV